MIYGFIKENNEYIDKDEQKKRIKEFIDARGWKIDRYLLDDYKQHYNEISILKRGCGTGTYVFNLERDDIIICSNFYTLAYSYKTILFLIKEILKRGAKVYCVEGDIEINKRSLRTIEILYDLHCLFDRIRNEKTLCLSWGSKLEPFRSQIETDVQNGIPIRQMSRKYKVTETTVRKFIRNNPKLCETYKKTNYLFMIAEKRNNKILNKRAFLKRQCDRQLRKAKANISRRAALLLAEEMEKQK